MRRMDSSMVAAEKSAALAEKKQEVRQRAGLSYVLLEKDALLKDGRFRDKKVSELMLTVEGRDYLGGELWKIAADDLKSVIRAHFSD